MDKSEELFIKLREYCKQNQMCLTNENFCSVCKVVLTKKEYELCFLSDNISKRIDELATEGDSFFEREEYGKAIKIYKKGIELIPEPKNLWETKLWFTAAISDSYWYLKNYEKALEYLNDSLEVEGGKESGFVRLRRGQVLFELKLIDEAKSELKIGYKLNGEKLFENEDRKYLELIKK